jgi:hypothetical protein
VFCVDEKTHIQALDRKDPVLPLSPGRAERHTSAEFIAFLIDILVNQPRGKEIHVIADNLSAHKSQQVKDFLLSCAASVNGAAEWLLGVPLALL